MNLFSSGLSIMMVIINRHGLADSLDWIFESEWRCNRMPRKMKPGAVEASCRSQISRLLSKLLPDKPLSNDRARKLQVSYVSREVQIG